MSCYRRETFKREIESLLRTAQNNAIRPNYTKVKIDKTQQNSERGLYGNRDKTIHPIISEQSILV